MIEFLSNLNRKRLKSLFLVHGRKIQQEIFKSALENHGSSNIKLPKFKEEFTLTPGRHPEKNWDKGVDEGVLARIPLMGPHN